MSRPDLSGVTEFESRSRTVHSHWDGVEIQRTYHMRPFSQAHQVAAALQGSVYYEVVGARPQYVRSLPARDSLYPDCYCNEVRIDHVDPQKDSISFSPSIGWSRLTETRNAETQIGEFLERTRLVAEQPAGGAFLTASYRPLLSAYRPFKSPGEDEPSDFELGRQFDWIEPRFTPGNMSVPWPEGLATVFPEGDTYAQVPPETANPIHIPVHEFTIRRLLVGKVPWNTINNLTNTVNAGTKDAETVEAMLSGYGWPYREDQDRLKLPHFAPGTLRFDKCEVISHYCPVALDNVWFELIYHFSWLCFKDRNVYSTDGRLLNPEGLADVTWNHVFMRPSFLGYTGPLGWYYVFKVKAPDWAVFKLPFIRLIRVGQGPLYGPGDFDTLFDLQAE